MANHHTIYWKETPMPKLTKQSLLGEICGVLYPDGDNDHEWEVSDLDAIAEIVSRYRPHVYPKPKAAATPTPPDKHRCQAGVPGNGPFTMGGEIGDPRNGYRTRCKNKPVWIATEKEPGADGLIGSMALCNDCRNEMVHMMPGQCTFRRLVTLKKPKEKKES